MSTIEEKPVRLTKKGLPDKRSLGKAPKITKARANLQKLLESKKSDLSGSETESESEIESVVPVIPEPVVPAAEPVVVIPVPIVPSAEPVIPEPIIQETKLKPKVKKPIAKKPIKKKIIREYSSSSSDEEYTYKPRKKTARVQEPHMTPVDYAAEISKLRQELEKVKIDTKAEITSRLTNANEERMKAARERVALRWGGRL